MKLFFFGYILLSVFTLIQCTKVGEPISTSAPEPLDLDGIVSMSYTTNDDITVTGINFTFLVEDSGNIIINIRNVTGYIVKDIYEGPVSAGIYQYEWDLSNNDSAPVIKGPYLLYVSINGKEGFQSFTNCLSECY